MWRWALPLFGWLLFSSVAWAARWEVAVIFMGAQDDTEAYQQALDRNILELAMVAPNDNYHLTIYREFPMRAVSFFADPTPHSEKLVVWDPLFQNPPPPGRTGPVKVPGEMKEQPGITQLLLNDDDRLRPFFKRAFSDPQAKRLLVIYDHGAAFEGIRGVRLADLETQLANFLPSRGKEPPLDLLWLNSCFMATIEVAYELRKLTSYFLASEDAEFTAGAPFQSFRSLREGPEASETVATGLAQAYIESYSVKEKGVQSGAVISTSATIAVIETARLPMLVEGLTWLVGTLKPLGAKEKLALQRSRKRIEIQIKDAKKMIDLGSFLRYLSTRSDLFPGDDTQARFGSLLHLLEADIPAKVHSAPRLPLIPPKPEVRLVFGFGGWKQGHKADTDTLAKVEDIHLKLDNRPEKNFRFIPGIPEIGGDWPSRHINKHFTVSPFPIGIDQFDYYFVEDKAPYVPLTPPQSFARAGRDFAVFSAGHHGNPIRFSGYTQQSGREAEKYTGLSVLDPTLVNVPPAYSRNGFSQTTHWEELLLP